jgi:small subunit ribosomal protein S3
MGQKVNPVGFRLGYIRGWESNWYGGKNFAEKLVEDDKIRKYINARIPKGSVSRVVIERTLKRITLTIHTARPGIVIGKAGSEVDKLREELKKLTKKDVQINIFEIKRPEIDAKLVGETIAQQLRARISFRRAMKQAIQSAMRVGAQGIKIKLSGRLG